MVVYTTGVEGGTAVPRLEIRELMLPENKDLRNMYILGLKNMQAKPANDPSSWYQISGIHGLPDQAWDDFGPEPGSRQGPGYSVPRSDCFPTWNRAYVALFEQILFENVREVAQTMEEPLKTIYTNHLPTFRAPYFDPALPGPPPRIIFASEKIVVPSVPDGTLQLISNPLLKYDFPKDHATPSADLVPGEHNDMSATTHRYPALSAPDRAQAVRTKLESLATGLPARLRDMFEVANFVTFASIPPAPAPPRSAWAQPPIGRPNTHKSLENIHDSVREDIGGGGHMSYDQVAAFDPIFWLHRCNIERLFAMWQAVHPDQYIVNGLDTPLNPFRKSAGGVFTSGDIREHTTFRSTYSELAAASLVPAGERAEHVHAAIQCLYGPYVQSREVVAEESDPRAAARKAKGAAGDAQAAAREAQAAARGADAEAREVEAAAQVTGGATAEELAATTRAALVAEAEARVAEAKARLAEAKERGEEAKARVEEAKARLAEGKAQAEATNAGEKANEAAKKAADAAKKAQEALNKAEEAVEKPAGTAAREAEAAAQEAKTAAQEAETAAGAAETAARVTEAATRLAKAKEQIEKTKALEPTSGKQDDGPATRAAKAAEGAAQAAAKAARMADRAPDRGAEVREAVARAADAAAQAADAAAKAAEEAAKAVEEEAELRKVARESTGEGRGNVPTRLAKAKYRVAAQKARVAGSKALIAEYRAEEARAIAVGDEGRAKAAGDAARSEEERAREADKKARQAEQELRLPKADMLLWKADNRVEQAKKRVEEETVIPVAEEALRLAKRELRLAELIQKVARARVRAVERGLRAQSRGSLGRNVAGAGRMVEDAADKVQRAGEDGTRTVEELEEAAELVVRAIDAVHWAEAILEDLFTPLGLPEELGERFQKATLDFILVSMLKLILRLARLRAKLASDKAQGKPLDHGTNNAARKLKKDLDELEEKLLEKRNTIDRLRQRAEREAADREKAEQAKADREKAESNVDTSRSLTSAWGASVNLSISSTGDFPNKLFTPFAGDLSTLLDMKNLDHQWLLPNPKSGPSISNTLHYKYQADIRVPRDALKGPLSVCFFVGHDPKVEHEPIDEEYLAGSFDIDTTSRRGEREGDAANDTTITGSIPLNLALGKYLKGEELKSLKPDHVSDFLRDRLSWRIRLPGGSTMGGKDGPVPNLKVGVSYVVAGVPDSDRELPEYGEPENLYDVTGGRTYGISEDDELLQLAAAIDSLDSEIVCREY
ncbi:hypothetical protein DFP73DRAFT_538427 [Morchella snyderi]|nr:hypothetical protein DFP73DRAFT_538427 [Morchella snyderi]